MVWYDELGSRRQDIVLAEIQAVYGSNVDQRLCVRMMGRRQEAKWSFKRKIVDDDENTNQLPCTLYTCYEDFASLLHTGVLARNL